MCYKVLHFSLLYHGNFLELVQFIYYNHVRLVANMIPNIECFLFCLEQKQSIDKVWLLLGPTFKMWRTNENRTPLIPKCDPEPRVQNPPASRAIQTVV
jgi:hypothetical protein